MNGFLFVALGGAFGAAARHGVGLLALRHLPPGWPHGTFAVNVFGSLAMGLVVGWLVSRDGATMSEMR
ncbi:MAG: CrcB family protein, partial [Pseudomonadota bacterium]